MKAVGIIAEYNPFHNGHSWQIQEAKRLSGADFAVIVMSPDFVQRGEPALLDKYSRTRMALECGADLVLELPVCYACGSAEYFAEGAVSLLHQLNCIDFLSFGCETRQTQLFAPLADFFLSEPEAYRQLLLSGQKKGLTFPKAREAALLSFLKENPNTISSSFLPMISEFISSPNNILGLEYQKALLKLKSSIALLPVHRKGSGYHSLDLNQSFCSASAVRQKLLDFERTLSHFSDDKEAPTAKSLSDTWILLKPFLPDSSYALLQTWQYNTGFIRFADFSALLHYKLLSEHEYTAYLDVTSDLSVRIRKLLPVYQDPDQFVSLLKTKQMTEARIRRALLHILLNIPAADTNAYRQQGITSYARILGFHKEASPLLRQIRQTSDIPLITKLADAKKILNKSAMQMLAQDIYASHLYQIPVTARTGRPILNEYTHSPMIL